MQAHFRRLMMTCAPQESRGYAFSWRVPIILGPIFGGRRYLLQVFGDSHV